MKVVVYSCVVGGYDEKISPIPSNFCFDTAILFSDNSDVTSSGWVFKHLVSPNNITRPDLINRYHKFFPHLIFKDVDVSIYIDGNVEIRKNIEPLIGEFLNSKKSFGCLVHPQRDNIIQEAKACIDFKKFKNGDQHLVSKQIDFYMSNKFPLDAKLKAATVLFRNHHQIDSLHSAMSLWWEQVNNFTCRDQLSLPFVLWKTGLSYMTFDIDIFNNEYFLRRSHKKESVLNRIKNRAKKIVDQIYSISRY